jgi:hypothetical protein
LARPPDERLPVERLELERDALERVPDERVPDARDPLDRVPEERVPDERVPDDRVPDERDAVEALVLRDPAREVPDVERELRDERDEDEFAWPSAWRSLSKSFSACLLVRVALRRSAERAAVTSL